MTYFLSAYLVIILSSENKTIPEYVPRKSQKLYTRQIPLIINRAFSSVNEKTLQVL